MNKESLKELIDFDSLQSFFSCGNLSMDTTDEITSMIRKEKEKQVLQLHNYKITGPCVSGNRTYYTTRAPWTPVKRVNRNSYNDLIDYLYEHYFGSSNDNITVCEVYEMMIEEYDRLSLVSPLTLSHYKADWNKHVVGNGAVWLNKPIKSIMPGQIYNFYRMITASEGMKRSTFNNVKTVINAVFDYAYNMSIPCIKTTHISTNKLKFAPVEDKWDGVYTTEDKRKILAVCEEMKPTVYTKAIELMFCLDIRIGELRALQKSDVDMEKRIIDVSHQMVDVKTATANRHPVRSGIMKGKKEAGRRKEPLSDRAIRVIEWLNEYNSQSVWLLPNRSGNEPIYTNRFNENLKKVCKKADVKYFSSHGIRFHNISAMYDAGISEKEIQRLSGHTTAMMTRHYNRSVSTSCEDEKICAVLG